MLYLGNREPPLDEVLDDPIVRLVMARDRLLPEEVRVNIQAAQRRLREARRGARVYLAPYSLHAVTSVASSRDSLSEHDLDTRGSGPFLIARRS